MPLPSPIALLFFPVGLFVPVGGSVPSTAGPLFFSVGLFVLCALSGGALFFSLGLSVFALPSIVSPFLFPVGLFGFQMGGLVTPVGMYIFHDEYVTSWVF